MRCMLLVCVLAFAGGAADASRAEPPPIEAYAAYPAASNLSLSPSGRRAAFLVANKAGRRIVVQEVGGKVLATVDPGALKLRGIRWAGEQFLLITSSSTTNLGMDWGFKHELDHVEILDLQTLKTVVAFEHTPKISNIVQGTFGVAEKGGRWYGYFGGITLAGDTGAMGAVYANHGYPDLYEVDLETGAARIAAHGSEREHRWVVGPDGQVIAHSEYDEKTGDWRLLAGPGSGGREILALRTPLGEINLIGQGRTAGTVLVVDGSGTDEVYEEVSLADGKIQPLLAGRILAAVIFDENTGLLLGAQARDPEDAVLFDAERQAKVRGAFNAFPGRRATLLAYDPNFDEMIVETDGGDDSGAFWYIDIPKHAALPLGAMHPDIPPAEVGPTRMFSYKAADGLALEGVLTLPPHGGFKGLPLVVMPHGGPLWARDDVGFDPWPQAYASRGYAVFQPNYRGSGGYGLAFVHRGYGEWGRKMLSDMSDGVAALAGAGIVDRNRACIVGISYGGYAALAGVTLQHGLYRCAVAVAGVSDMPAMRRWELDRRGEGDSETRREWRTAIEGQDKDGPELAAISPARLADRADAPVLLVHGTDDTVVPIDQSRRMASALKAAGKPVTLLEISGQDHWLSDEAGDLKMLSAAVDFVQKHNPPN